MHVRIHNVTNVDSLLLFLYYQQGCIIIYKSLLLRTVRLVVLGLYCLYKLKWHLSSLLSQSFCCCIRVILHAHSMNCGLWLRLKYMDPFAQQRFSVGVKNMNLPFSLLLCAAQRNQLPSVRILLGFKFCLLCIMH